MKINQTVQISNPSPSNLQNPHSSVCKNNLHSKENSSITYEYSNSAHIDKTVVADA